MNLKEPQMRIIQSSVYTGLVVLFLVSMGAGCASTHKTTTTTTQTTVQSPSKEVVSDNTDQTVVEKNKTTTTSTETKPRETGIIGGLFHIIGSVIAFPFIVIGGLLRMIF
jgi:hypothetical protein